MRNRTNKGLTNLRRGVAHEEPGAEDEAPCPSFTPGINLEVAHYALEEERGHVEHRRTYGSEEDDHGHGPRVHA